MTWYVIDRRTNEIINAIEADYYERAMAVVAKMEGGPQNLRIDRNPPRAMLEKYKYWNERP